MHPLRFNQRHPDRHGQSIGLPHPAWLVLLVGMGGCHLFESGLVSKTCEDTPLGCPKPHDSRPHQDTSEETLPPSISILDPSERGDIFWSGEDFVFRLEADDPDDDLETVQLEDAAGSVLASTSPDETTFDLEASLPSDTTQVVARAIDATGNEDIAKMDVEVVTCTDKSPTTRWTFDADQMSEQYILDSGGSSYENGYCVFAENEAQRIPCETEPGVYAEALTLSGDQVFALSQFSPGTQETPITIMTWLAASPRSVDANSAAILALAGSDHSGFNLYPGDYELNAIDGTRVAGQLPRLQGILEDGEWHHVALILDPSAGIFSIFADGSLLASDQGTFPYAGQDWVALLLGVSVQEGKYFGSTTLDADYDDFSLAPYDLSDELRTVMASRTAFCGG